MIEHISLRLSEESAEDKELMQMWEMLTDEHPDAHSKADVLRECIKNEYERLDLDGDVDVTDEGSEESTYDAYTRGNIEMLDANDISEIVTSESEPVIDPMDVVAIPNGTRKVARLLAAVLRHEYDYVVLQDDEYDDITPARNKLGLSDYYVDNGVVEQSLMELGDRPGDELPIVLDDFESKWDALETVMDGVYHGSIREEVLHNLAYIVDDYDGQIALTTALFRNGYKNDNDYESVEELMIDSTPEHRYDNVLHALDENTKYDFDVDSLLEQSADRGDEQDDRGDKQDDEQSDEQDSVEQDDEQDDEQTIGNLLGQDDDEQDDEQDSVEQGDNDITDIYNHRVVDELTVGGYVVKVKNMETSISGRFSAAFVNDGVKVRPKGDTSDEMDIDSVEEYLGTVFGDDSGAAGADTAEAAD